MPKPFFKIYKHDTGPDTKTLWFTMENMELYIKQWQILNNFENLICYGQNYVNIPKTKVNCSFWLGINYQLFYKDISYSLL